MSERRYEHEDLADHRRALAGAGGVVGGLIALGFVVSAVAGRLVGGAPPEGVEGMLPTDELNALRATVEAEWAARAAAWEWVDEAHGVARIPVWRAAELALARGLPTRRDTPRPVTARGLR
ncbi:hypothetical protein [Nannocystis pusilla]|uniref:Uncharacterized protein n=1 Tax=Nannocystis pusilla TaxID=889268 RepID=A0ABS7TK90_9BACT|nr:hypothetical protein [Nannocystis pusilla]MBZ5708603.1 hypothetical protein [Nannocystis pusilla]